MRLFGDDEPSTPIKRQSEETAEDDDDDDVDDDADDVSESQPV